MESVLLYDTTLRDGTQGENINFAADEWARIGMMVLVFCLYLGVFYMVGMLMSALTRNSFVSFLVRKLYEYLFFI